MNFDKFSIQEMPPKIENDFLLEHMNKYADNFLGEEKTMIDQENFSEIINETVKETKRGNDQVGNENKVIYDKYKKRFQVGNEKEVSMGSIVGAKRWGIEVSFPENQEQSGDKKKLRKIIQEKKSESMLYDNLNKKLAEILFEKTKKIDVLKAKAYEEIAKRSGTESKQLGIVAEQIVMGVLEGLVIDRPDLRFNVIEANAYQDVNNKIDFIIYNEQKKRGVGIDEKEFIKEGKSIGIQFTINTSKSEHKADQIIKAKERGVEVDDIIYVEIEKRILQGAMSKWEENGKPIAGPWKFLSPEIRKQVLSNLLNGILNEEQKISLIKNEK